MTMPLDGSCQCGAVRFSVESHTPVPYQRCYCSICRKAGGDGGFAVNIGAVMPTLRVTGTPAHFHARTADGTRSVTERHYCPDCGSPLWVHDARWPDLVHPFAGAIDTALPTPPKRVHMMLGSKPDWVGVELGPDDDCFDGYPDLSLADWHKANGLWID